MLTAHSMVYFAPGTWAGLWRNRHQLMHLFARHGNKVLFVEGRSHLRNSVGAWQRGAVGRQALAAAPLQRIDDNLYVLRYPLWMPISGQRALGWMTQQLRARLLRQTLQRLEMAAPIVWFSQPSMVDLLDEIPDARLRLYHVVDEYAAYSGQSLDHSRREATREAALMRQVDAVIVVSEKLYAAKRQAHPDTYLVPNGVNYAAYCQALADPALPIDLAAIPTPRIGYSGLIGDRLDLPMLQRLALAHPEWSWVLIGEARLVQQQAAWAALTQLPNVYALGQKPIEEVPHYLKGLQVGIMPYVQNRESEHISPLKLYDYLAAGVAVASMEIPAVADFRPYIHVAQTPEDFAAAVGAALADNSPARQALRRSVAAQHTWEARAEQLSALIRQQLQRVALPKSHTVTATPPRGQAHTVESSKA
jgi:glycosyltransferase involved in cell wall biosynthesis